jgi:predicted metal-dependent phosphoesterase TrpH
MKLDLHIHTNISDGSFSISEVLQRSKEKAVTHIGITNHDTVCGLKEAIGFSKKMGIKVIPGIEISAYDKETKRKIHILGYNFNLKGENIRKICDPILNQRHNNSLWQIEQLIKNGYKIDVNNIFLKAKTSKVIYKKHIMEELIDKKYTDKIYSDLYRILFKNNGICARNINYADAYEAVKAIKKDGGIPVLAHPGQLKSYDFIEKLIESGLKGIEIYHISHNEEDHKKIRNLSKKYNLILTGGSDFHGKYGDNNVSIGDIESPKEFFNYLVSN